MDLISLRVDDDVGATLQRLLRGTHTDDYVVLALILILGICYLFRGILWDVPDPYFHLWFERPQEQNSSEKSKPVATRDIALKLETDKKEVLIFWGSQSGTGEGFANRLARDCKSRFGIESLSADISDYDPESIAKIPHSKLAIFIVSTYGDGDPSDNATQFMAWLGTNKTVSFSGLRYAAFGLGNSKYKHYNRVVDVLTKHLNQLRATAILRVGKADDAMGATEEDFIQWRQNLFSVFRTDLGFKEVPSHYEPVFQILEDESLAAIDLHIGEPIQSASRKKLGMACSSIRPLPIKESKKLFSSSERSCLHIEVDLTDQPELKYTTGDHLAIWPSNPTSEVDHLLCVLGRQEQKQTPLLITSFDKSVPSKIPSPTTLEVLFRYYVEICSPVSRETISQLSQFASSPTTKAHLVQLSENKSEFQQYFCKSQNTLANFLERMTAPGETWSALPLSFILETLPSTTPRYYSISSSSIVQPRHIAITVATSTMNENQEPIPGVTTNYLLDLERDQNDSTRSQPPRYELSGPNGMLHGNRIFAHIRKSKFRLPVLAKHPIIMIASGSGIAPFRGFLQERARLAAIGREIGPSFLFFGCQNSEQYLYREELDHIATASEGKMAVVTAFSREGKMTYVQDRIQEYDQEILNLLIESNGYLYICGSARMARDVADRLGTCFGEKLGWNEHQLRDWSEGMKKDHRWQEDVWR